MPSIAKMTPKFLQIDNSVYAVKENSDANKSADQHVNDYLSSGIGDFRFFKFMGGGSALLNEAYPSKAAKEFSHISNNAWQLFSFPRTFTATHAFVEAIGERNKEVFNPYKNTFQEKSSSQSFWRNAETAKKGADAGAMISYSASTILGCMGQKGPAEAFSNAGELFTGGHDVLDLSKASYELYLASQAKTKLTQECGQAKDSKSVKIVCDTIVNTALRVAKAFFASVGSLIAAATMAGLVKVGALAKITIGLVTQIFAVGVAFHAKGIQHKPLDMIEAYDMSRPPLKAKTA